MKQKIVNVAIYCRVSTEEQRKFGLSLDDQRDSLTKYCKDNKYKIYDYYIDEGVSAGTITKRKELVRLLNDLDNIDLIIFTKLDRFSRNIGDANNLLKILEKHNCAFKAIDEEDVDVSNADSKFLFDLKVSLAERERSKDSERINRVNNYKYTTAKTVCTGAKIFGYDISEDKKLIVNEVEKKQVNALFDKYIETNCLSETVRWFQTNIKQRSYDSIKLYLKNTAYIGLYKHTKKKTKEVEIVEHFCPPIVDEEKFYKVQKMFETNVKKYTKNIGGENGNKTDYLFNGLLYCKCGKRLSGKHSKGKHYYICKNALTSICDNKLHISEIKLEQYLIENIHDFVQKEIKKYSIIGNESKEEKIDIKNKINNIKRKIEKITNLYLEDMIDIEYYKKEYSNLKKELENLQKEEINIQEPKDFSNYQKILDNGFLDMYTTMTNKQKRELWMILIEKITYNSKIDFEIKLSCTK